MACVGRVGPWQSLRKRRHRYSGDARWDGILGRLLTAAGARGHVGFLVGSRQRPVLGAVGGRRQGGDAPIFGHLMNQLKITRAGPGSPRSHADRVRGNKAY